MDALEKVILRNQFYKRQFYLSLSMFGLSFILVISLFWMMLSLMRNPVRPAYFAVDEIGRLIHEVPLNKPNMDLNAVKAWVSHALEDAYSYDFVNYRGQLQNAQRYFTEFGWRSYMAALRNNNSINVVSSNKYVFKSRVVDSPKLIEEGLLGSTYAWKFQVPVLVTYWKPPYTDRDKFFNPLTFIVLVQRRPTLQADHGLGILQIYADFSTVVPQEIQDKPN